MSSSSPSYQPLKTEMYIYCHLLTSYISSAIGASRAIISREKLSQIQGKEDSSEPKQTMNMSTTESPLEVTKSNRTGEQVQ